MIGRTLFCSLSVFTLSEIAQAQTERDDSLKVYRLGEITVGAERDREVRTTTVQQIPFWRIQRADVPTAERLADQIPGAKIRMNSRGEALIFLRGTGERQVATFLDGASLNIPWDNRIDLSLLPMNAIGGITISKGVPSVLYGANVIGGAINFVSQERSERGFLSYLTAQGGEHGFLGTSYTNMGAFTGLNYVATVGYSKRDGYRLPAGALPMMHQASEGLRTNTQQRLVNGYGRIELEASELSTIGLSLNFIDGEKGIAPEGHQPVGDARFWKYPDWRYINATVNLDQALTADRALTLRGAMWANSFRQVIDQYLDADYATMDAREENEDLTFGTRLVLRKDFKESALNFAVNALTSLHDQREIGYESGLAPSSLPDIAQYQQHLYSIGLEYEWSLLQSAKLVAGATYDGMQTPKTGDKPTQGNFSDYSVMTGVSYDLDPSLTLRASAGRKTRFPTMRELYGEALRRFILNPHLRAESSVIAETGLKGSYTWGTFDIVGFGYFTSGTIERIDTIVGDRTFRKRVNLEGSTTPGLEVSAFITELNPLKFEASLTWLKPRATKANKDGSFYLSERPEILAMLTMDYTFPWGLQPTLEISHTGTAYSPDGNNVVSLPTYTLLNGRLAHRFFFNAISGELFVRMNNITDAVPLNQLGLPGPGREFQGGIKLTF